MMTKDTGKVGLHKNFSGLSGIYYFCAEGCGFVQCTKCD